LAPKYFNGVSCRKDPKHHPTAEAVKKILLTAVRRFFRSFLRVELSEESSREAFRRKEVNHLPTAVGRILIFFTASGVWRISAFDALSAFCNVQRFFLEVIDSEPIE
jgi:hypothetical protein